MTPATLSPLPPAVAPLAVPIAPQRPVATEPSYRWCLLLGLGGMTFVRLIGYLAFTEAYFLITAPWRFGKHLRLITHGVGGTFTALWIGWVLVALASDFWNDVPFELMARGVSRAFFTGLAILSVFLVCVYSWKRFDYMLLGIPISMVISLFVFKPGQQDIYEHDFADALKFQTSLNYILTAVIIAFATVTYRKRPWLVIAGLFAAGPTYILMGSRAMGAIFVAAGLTTMVTRTLVSRRLRTDKRVTWWRLTVFAVAAVSLLITISTTYEYLASRELLDERQVEKYQRESQAEGGVFFGSRGVYILTGLMAWWDKPILGHGSWPQDENGYYRRAAEMLNVTASDYRYAPVKGASVRRMLPIHSVLISALAEHGPIAFLFFAYLGFLNFAAIRVVPVMLPQYIALYSILLWLNTWNLLASPQGHRVPSALAFCFPLLVRFYALSKAKGTLL